MTSTEKAEIDAVLSAYADGEAGVEQVSRLDALLLDRPDLQDYYCQQQTMLAMLRLEHTGAAPTAIQVVDCAATPPQVWSRPRRARSWGEAASGYVPRILAALLSAVFLGGLVLSVRTALPGGSEDASGVRAWSAALSSGSETLSLIMHDRGSLRLLERLTRYSMITNVRLPRAKSPEPGALRSGDVWFERVQSNRERGYLVRLPAGCRMEVAVDTDATSKNCLAVVEVNPSGLTTGQALVFDNTASFGTNNSDWQPPGKRDVGQIGSFSEMNGSSLPRYYLFTASYSLADRNGEENWKQSDFRIQFDAEDILVIGWDDCGYSGFPEDADEPEPDRDFNDMRAVLKFSFPEREGDSGLPVSRFLPDPIDALSAEVLPDEPQGFLLDLLPGEEALFSVSSDAKFQNSFLILEAESKRVLWKHDGVPADPDTPQPCERGIYVIRNLTDRVQSYEVRGRHKRYGETASDPWRPNPFQVSGLGAGAITVGFEDSSGIRKNHDWRDLQVYIKVYSP